MGLEADELLDPEGGEERCGGDRKQYKLHQEEGGERCGSITSCIRR